MRGARRIRERRRMSEMGCWSRGVLEYWVLNPLLHLIHDSSTPACRWAFFSGLLAGAAKANIVVTRAEVTGEVPAALRRGQLFGRGIVTAAPCPTNGAGP